MRIELGEGGDLVLAGVDPLLEKLLEELPEVAGRTRNDAARRRLFPDPAADPDLNRDWREYVEPELRGLFRAADDAVREDLAAREKEDDFDEVTLRIPPGHIDQWLNCLTRARLVVFEENGFSEEEMEEVGPIDLRTPRDLARFRMAMYGLIEEFIIHAANGG